MLKFLNVKLLLALLLFGSPVAALWLVGDPATHPGPPVVIERIPVEVISKGSAPTWVYVEVGNQAVPEPGVLTLLGLTSLLLLLRRRQRT